MMTAVTTLRFGEALDRFVDNIPAQGKVLDLAYKQGLYARMLVEKGFDVMAISATSDLQTPVTDIRIKIQHKSLSDTSLPYRTFHGIWAADSMIGVSREQFLIYLSQFVDWLRSGGILSFCMLEGEGHKIIKQQSPLGGMLEKRLVYYLPEEIEQILTNADCPAVEAWYETHGQRRFIQVLAKRN